MNFNCLLMLAPSEVLDYVVVHELCHRKEMNHSKAFWIEVEKAFPDYRDMVKWLKEEGSLKKALYQSADAFTAQDLEDLYGCVDDELIIDLAKRYKIPAPADLADEYEEELCPDAGTPICYKGIGLLSACTKINE